VNACQFAGLGADPNHTSHAYKDHCLLEGALEEASIEFGNRAA
jgi:hypothetical protein